MFRGEDHKREKMVKRGRVPKKGEIDFE